MDISYANKYQKDPIANFYGGVENISGILVRISIMLLHSCVKPQKIVINLGSAKVFTYVSLKCDAH